MAKYVLPIMIEANSKQEAEQKLLQLLKVGKEYQKFTFNDVFGGIVTACTEVVTFLDDYKKAKNLSQRKT
jgi:hypothetical protein